MSERNEWGSSVVKRVFTNVGNNLQTPKPAKPTLKHYKNERCAVRTTFPGSFPSSSRCQGWSAHGIKRFNELFGLVEKEQSSCFGSQFEKDYLEHCINAREQGKKKKNRNLALYEVCRHELWTASTSGECNCIKDDEIEPDSNQSEGFLTYNRNDEQGQDDNKPCWV